MVTQVKKNEAVALPLFKNGVNLQFIKVTFPSDVSAKTSATTVGIKSPVVQALEAITARVSVEIMAPLQSGGTVLPLAIAAIGGDYPADNYDGTAGTETLVAYLQTLVQAAGVSTGALQSVSNTTTTVLAGWPALA
jgi:hypothetical protein